MYFLFLLSGASGLIYQVIWVREFGNVFGNTIYSASLVVAVFMRGLLKHLATRIYFPDEPANNEDPILKLVPA